MSQDGKFVAASIVRKLKRYKTRMLKNDLLTYENKEGVEIAIDWAIFKIAAPYARVKASNKKVNKI